MLRPMMAIYLYFFALILMPTLAQAQVMRAPRVEAITVEWQAAFADFEPYRQIIDKARAERRLGLAARAQIAALKQRFATLRDADLPATVNQLVGERFRYIAASPTPVLLPFDVARYLTDRLGPTGAAATSTYLNGFSAFKYFRPGPSGYDASFQMPGTEVAKIAGVTFNRDVSVVMSGSSLFYVLDDPTPPAGTIDARFPQLSGDVRRVEHEQALRFTFTRHGAPYLVSIECRPRADDDMPSCADAEKIGAHFLQSLRLAGGAPPRSRQAITSPNTIDRPKCPDAQFTYNSPGSLLPGSGYSDGQFQGKIDYTVYARIASPIDVKRSYANSQVFMHGGGCLSSDTRNNMEPKPHAPTDVYHCKQNPAKNLTFFEGIKENYSYPWRDNFCESREWQLGQCPGNNGHQGQDIRPNSCDPIGPDAASCKPYRHRINAVRSGIVQREKGKQALYLVVNTATEHIRFRYLHMSPKHLDHDGMVTGRELSEGERIGLMGRYLGEELGTTYHLHFDVQVPTRDGWIYVSPYMTLVAAHERHIGGFGREIKDDGSIAGPAPGVGCR